MWSCLINCKILMHNKQCSFVVFTFECGDANMNQLSVEFCDFLTLAEIPLFSMICLVCRSFNERFFLFIAKLYELLYLV